MDFASQGEGCHIFFGRSYIVIDDRSAGFHSVSHLVGNVAFDDGSNVIGYDDPEKYHACQGNGGGNDTDTRSKFLIRQKFHMYTSIFLLQNIARGI